MSNTNQIDFSTLTWVKAELDETLERAKEALRTYIEDSEDSHQLQFCVTYLHQVQGTLKMVELYGAAMVAEEMEMVAQDLLDDKVQDTNAAYDVLLQSILQLPDYLERIELGHKDVPIVLLPLVNDLRAVRNKRLLSESALFNPDLSLGVPSRLLKDDFSMKGGQLQRGLSKVRSVYQVALLHWIKDDNKDKALSNIQLLVNRLQTLIGTLHLKQLFWVYSAVIEGLRAKVVEDTISVKQMGGAVDIILRGLVENPRFSASKTNPVVKNLLYFIASSSGKGRLITEVKQFFELEQFIPDEEEIKQAEGSLSGKNKDLLQTVSQAINDDVLIVQESLDLYIRNKSAETAELKPLLNSLQKIADTLGILGLGTVRDDVLMHQNILNKAIEEDRRPADNELLEVAKSLLILESQLQDHIQSLGIAKPKDEQADNSVVAHNIPQTEKMEILRQLVKESIVNLQQVKVNFITFIESSWDKESVKDNPKLLRDISGALSLLQFNDASAQLEVLIDYMENNILSRSSKPSAAELEQLATTISTFEYYLENLEQGSGTQHKLLEQVSAQMDKLKTFEQQQPEEQQQVEEQQVEEQQVEEQQVEEQQVEEQQVEEQTEVLAEADEQPQDNDSVEEAVDRAHHLVDDLEFEQAVDRAHQVTDELTPEEERIEYAAIPKTEPVAKQDSEPTEVADDASQQQQQARVTFGEKVDEEIKEIFIEEFEEELANLQEKHHLWQSAPEDHETELTEIRRIFHTLKGSGRLVGAEYVGEFGWQMENMCNRLLDGGIKRSSAFHAVMDVGVSMAGDLFEALSNQSELPFGYHRLLNNAEQVAQGHSEVQFEEKPVEVSTADRPEPQTNEEVVEQQEAEVQDLSALEFELGSAEEDDAIEIEEDLFEEQEQLDDLEEVLPDDHRNTEEEDLDFDLDEELGLFEKTADSEQIAADESEEQASDLGEGLNLLSQSDDDLLDLGFGMEDDDKEEIPTETIDESEVDETDITEDDFDWSLEEISEQPTADDEQEQEQEQELTIDIDEEQDEPAAEELSVDPVFIEILQKEVGGHLLTIKQFVASGSDQVTEAFTRAVHTINGAASMAEVTGITQMMGPLERMSVRLRKMGQDLSVTDKQKIAQVVIHAEQQMSALGEENVETDFSLGDYFLARIAELKAIADHDVEVADDLETHEEQAEDHETTAKQSLLFEPAIEHVETEAERVEAERIEAERIEAERIEAERIEAERIEAERIEAERIEAERAEAERAEAERAEAERAEAERAEAERIEAERAAEQEAATISPLFADSEQQPEADSEIEPDYDEELLEIFGEEANEIIDRSDHLLSELEERADDSSIIQALQRDLHTLKGGARMAGLHKIGDLSHKLESLFESIAEKGEAVSPEQHEMMSAVMYKLHNMVTAKDYGQSTNIDTEGVLIEQMLSGEGTTIEQESKLDKEFFDPLNKDVQPFETDSEQKPSEQPQEAQKQSNVLSGGQIKVNAELLDKLVNFAGEVSIYRSRMEQQSAELRLNIDELENTVDRVRRLLRELEHETEAQILSTYQQEEGEFNENFDPLELDQFSTLQQLSRSLAESVADLNNIQGYLQDSVRSSETLLLQQSRVNTELQEGLMETRLVTFNSLVPRLRRVLRTASNELNKKAKLVVKGAEGEMDKTVLEGIQAPLEHMIRNSMVHGLERNRQAAGKPDKGQITIELKREATEVVVSVSDDGGGVNTEAIKAKAIAKGIIKASDDISEQEAVELITHSGLSGVDEVSKLAGRGVGMDVVRNEIKRLGGSLEIVSQRGKGSTFIIRLPYTLALTQAIIAQVADSRYAIPTSGVEGLVRMDYDEFVRRIKNNDLDYNYAGEQYQVQELNKLLSIDSEPVVENGQVPLVMIRSGNQGVALRVDETFGGREIVVKSVGTQIASVPGIFGATILGDGAVILILDIIPMYRAYQQKLKVLEEQGITLVEETVEEKVTTIMIVDDSITMRRVGERMLVRNDFEVMTAKDGLDALNKLQEQVPDLMLLDIEMPRMDGFELASKMKESDKFNKIPIIMITSRTGQKHKDRATEIGVERYLGKPYQEVDLLNNINDLLDLEDAD